MTEQTAGSTVLVEANEAPRTSLRVVGIVWLVALVPGGLVTLLISVFALSPTVCPDAGGSFLCTHPSASAVGIGVVGALLLGALLAAIGSVAAHTKPRQKRLLGLSVLLAVAAPVVAAVSAASWS